MQKFSPTVKMEIGKSRQEMLDENRCGVSEFTVFEKEGGMQNSDMDI